MRVRTNGLIFFAAAFPFVVPLVPSTDTQPTFALFALFFAAAVSVRSFSQQVTLRKADLLLAGAIFGGGIVWLGVSLLVNGFANSNINRLVAFAMMLIAIMVGIINPRVATGRRVSNALKAYTLFTAIFFITHGRLESFIIKTRGDEISQLLLSGRGASTLSPEPSFFAFQIFTLFLIIRFTIWPRIGRRSHHALQLTSIGLLVSSLSGYGILYALAIVLMSVSSSAPSPSLSSESPTVSSRLVSYTCSRKCPPGCRMDNLR